MTNKFNIVSSTTKLEIVKLVHKANECAGYNGIQDLPTDHEYARRPATTSPTRMSSLCRETIIRPLAAGRKRKVIELEDEDDGYDTPCETSLIGEVT